MSEKKIVIKLKYGAADPRHQDSASTALPEYDWNYKRIALVVAFFVSALGLIGYGFLAGPKAPEIAGADSASERPGNINLSPPKWKPTQSPTNKNQSVTEDPATGVAEREQMEVNPAGSSAANTGLNRQSNQSPDETRDQFSGSAAADAAAFQESGALVDALEKPSGPSNIVRARFTWGIKGKEPAGQIRSPAILQPGDSVALYFFSEVKDMDGKSLIHEWSHNGVPAQRKDFSIDGNHWRGFSVQKLNSDHLGEWKVSIKDANQKNLAEFRLDVLAPVNRN